MEPTSDEVNAVLNKCAEAADGGRSEFFGMSYEQGVEAAIRWMLGEGENPLDD